MQLKLKNAQIELIERELREKGLLYEPLHEDLVDHFCCEIEGLMERGKGFGEAYKIVLMKFEQRGIEQLNQEAIQLLGHAAMIRNYFVTTMRVFRKNLLINSIRILGLSIGIAVFLLAAMYWDYEHSYDQFHEDADSIYRLGRVTDRGQEINTTFPLVPNLRIDFPDYLFSQFFKDRSRTLFRKNQISNYESGLIWADEYFLQFFDFDNFVGDAETALIEPFSIVITEEIGRQYFSGTPQLGDTIEISWNGEFYPLEITGIIPEWPENMHIEFDLLVSFQTGQRLFPGAITDSWEMNYCYSYVKLPVGTAPELFQSSFASFVEKHIPDQQSDYQEYLGFLQPLTAIHTQPEVIGGYTKTIDSDYLKLSLGTGFVILLITSLNFITLTVAQFHERSREVGIRKAVGAYKAQVVNLFLFETFFLVSLSFALSLLLMSELVQLGNYFFPAQLAMEQLWRSQFILLIPLFLIALTLATGLYPAIVISSSSILNTIQLKRKVSAFSFRKILMGGQFLLVASLISFCWIVYGQLNFIQNQSLGYNKDQVLYIPHARQIRYNPDLYKTRALDHPGIQQVSVSFYKPGDDITTIIDVEVNGQEAKSIAVNSVDEDFFDTYEIEFLAGTNFDPAVHNLNSVFIVNEAAIEYLELSDPFSVTLDSRFQTGQPDMPIEERSGRIVGVIKDVHFESLHSQIKPMVFLVKPYWYFFINVRFDSRDVAASISHLQNSWAEVLPDLPFEYQFLDEEFASLYENEQLIGRSLIALTVLAIVTACFGLFGYMRFLARQMVKEISMRKVLGAGFLQISLLVSRNCVWSILLASIVSWPIVYFCSQLWLENYSYRLETGILPYLIAFVSLIVISVLTISRELIRIEKTGLVETLRYD